MATIAEMVVSQEKWDRLTPELQAAARGMGIRPESEVAKEKKPSLPRVKVATQRQYILRVEETCSLCGEQFLRTYRMTPTLDKEVPYLKALIEPDKDVKVDKTERWTKRTCEYCYLSLMLWSPHKLATKCIELADPKVDRFVKLKEFRAKKKEEQKAKLEAEKEFEKMQAEAEAAAKRQKRRKKKR